MYFHVFLGAANRACIFECMKEIAEFTTFEKRTDDFLYLAIATQELYTHGEVSLV